MLKFLSRQRLWQLKQIAKGNCSICGKPRPPELSMRCRLHQDIWNKYQCQLRVRKQTREDLGSQRVGDEVI